MRCILREETDPYFNIAAEEYVLKNLPGDTFMLWRNEPSVIIGKHQNTLAEINLDFINQKNIKVVRRISGGGAVFHDLGNLNFTFVTTGEQHNLVNFDRFTNPIIEALSKLGIDVVKANKNSLYVNGLKISGNAEHVFKNKVLHHGTLLFATNLQNLDEAIKRPEIEYADKAVKSIRSIVTNISDHINQSFDIHQFKEFIMNEMLNMSNNAWIYSFSDEDIAAINKLKEEKYSTWEWNYSYSPSFSFSLLLKSEGKPFNVHITITNGIVNDITMPRDNGIPPLTLAALDSLKGTRFKATDLSIKLEQQGAYELARELLSKVFKLNWSEHLQNRSV